MLPAQNPIRNQFLCPILASEVLEQVRDQSSLALAEIHRRCVASRGDGGLVTVWHVLAPASSREQHAFLQMKCQNQHRMLVPAPPPTLPPQFPPQRRGLLAGAESTGRVYYPTGPSKPLPSLLRVRIWAPMSPSPPRAPSSSVFVLPLSWPPNVTLSAFCARPSMGTHASLGTRDLMPSRRQHVSLLFFFLPLSWLMHRFLRSVRVRLWARMRLSGRVLMHEDHASCSMSRFSFRSCLLG